MDDSDSGYQSAGWDSDSDQGSFQAYDEESEGDTRAQQPRTRTCTIITPVDLAHFQASGHRTPRPGKCLAMPLPVKPCLASLTGLRVSLPLQTEALASVTSILGCTRSTARKLLIHSRWDTEALFGQLLSSPSLQPRPHTMQQLRGIYPAQVSC